MNFYNDTRRCLLIVLITFSCTMKILASETPGAVENFHSAASSLNVNHPVNKSSLNISQQGYLIQLEQSAAAVMAQPNYKPVILNLLNESKARDGYERQILVKSIIYSKEYGPGDVLFLKDVFLATLDFTYETPQTLVKDWYTGFRIRKQIADFILGNTGHVDMVGRGDYNLLLKNPAAWLTKYAH